MTQEQRYFVYHLIDCLKPVENSYFEIEHLQTAKERRKMPLCTIIC